MHEPLSQKVGTVALNPGWYLFVTPGIVERREFPPFPKMAGANTCMGVGVGRSFG